jgi:amino acid transporter
MAAHLNTSTHALLHAEASEVNHEGTRPDQGRAGPHERRLTFIDGIGVSVGIIIGSGIFSSPGVALERSGSPGAALLAWVVAGMLVMCTSLCYIELGCKYPTSGGDFEYLTRAYGEQAAFSFAWFNFFISKPGSQAIIATIFGRYTQTVLFGSSATSNDNHNESGIVTMLAVMLIFLITLVNCIGIKESAILQNTLTASKLLLVLVLFVLGIAYSITDNRMVIENLSPARSFVGSKNIFSFGSALVACLWSFDGWADLNFMMEDLQNAQQSLPRVIFSGLSTVIVCYLLANVAYLTVLSQTQITQSPAIAYELGQQVASTLNVPVLPALLAIGVALSTVGSVNGSILTGGKAFYAVARDGKFAPAIFATLSTSGSPYPALLAQGGWGIVLLLLPGSSFSSLLNYLGPAAWFYYMLTSSAVVIMRRKHPAVPVNPGDPTPFTMPLYPIPVVIVIVIALIIIIGSFLNDPLYTSLSFSFLALSIPVHICLKWRTHAHESPVLLRQQEDEMEEAGL